MGVGISAKRSKFPSLLENFETNRLINIHVINIYVIYILILYI